MLLSAFEQGQLDSVQELAFPQFPPLRDGMGPHAPEPSQASVGGAISTDSQSPCIIQRTLRDAYERWAAVSDGGVDTKRSCARALALYEEWSGPTRPQVASVTRAQGHQFKAWLLEKSRTGEYASKTVHGYLVNVCSLLRFAHQELEWTTRHCWRGIAIEYQTESPRARWSAGHLETLAKLPLFGSMCVPPGWQSGGLAAYWLPLPGLYTGGTVSELCQLKVADVLDEREDDRQPQGGRAVEEGHPEVHRHPRLQDRHAGGLLG
jgi:integrase